MYVSCCCIKLSVSSDRDFRGVLKGTTGTWNAADADVAAAAEVKQLFPKSLIFFQKKDGRPETKTRQYCIIGPGFNWLGARNYSHCVEDEAI